MKDDIVAILEEKKVEDIEVVDVRTRSAFFDYFIIGTVESHKQSDAVVDELKKGAIRIHHIESTKESGWTLIDCFDVIVHLFTPEKRREYDLDSLWKNTLKTLNP